ncbi:MAG: hypothetical protein JWQ04_1658, partial [Pedosphaera sp.]|nr:hypothetical protein [Pedosphaera sp.]
LQTLGATAFFSQRFIKQNKRVKTTVGFILQHPLWYAGSMNAQNRVCRGLGRVVRGSVERATRPSPGPSTLNHFQPSTTSGRSFSLNQPLSHSQPTTIWSSQPHSANWNLELGYSLELGAWTLGASQTARSFSPNLYKSRSAARSGRHRPSASLTFRAWSFHGYLGNSPSASIFDCPPPSDACMLTS